MLIWGSGGKRLAGEEMGQGQPFCRLAYFLTGKRRYLDPSHQIQLSDIGALPHL
jgi:hypothetical protein